ncbi:MAG: hypothetical protein ACERKV_01170 [Clostridiaceae bacterium]
MTISILVNKEMAIQKINAQIRSGNDCIEYLKTNCSIDEMEKKFTLWVKETENSIRLLFSENQKHKEFLFDVKRNINKFSKKETQYLFFFIYDKDNIIKNVDAFTKGYHREKDDFGKDIETIINQPIII